MRKLLLSFLLLAPSLLIFAQNTASATQERAPVGLRAEGKIYVVLVVAVTILTGLFIYLIRLDKKIAKLEKNSSSL